ncbi:DegT/DnrJ/EryC1/StrS family aminotransferase [Candidatus Nitrosotenuis uzonensis]|uniref:Pyridoxal phosphate-dependent aminotransferase, cell wall synthesis related n=1 Tax=Candidatus Nitrosotenuis uzonensis TaxID=1407055 RepID=A0A812EXV2_9ARCH|nr:DegT/DnrJ/EryC1/StrS family aminotransferase [Candidatus Nitrosotenuis uzonensis]CAE6487069.1 Pyridoxal phosphate-dependent aminotransferase, cell wall synthesis related [Candidatus Nitrosotenuis uzonensis]
MAKKIKLFDPFVGKEEKTAVLEVLQSGFWASGAGTGKVLEFENRFNKYVGSDNCIAVNNGTSALHLALSLLDVTNREVIVPSMSFVSTANAVLYNGGRPVFADVDPKTLCIDPDDIKKLIRKKTVAILPVHFGGMPCRLDEIIEICDKYDITLIEDAAHAAGSTFKNKKIGSHGKAVCFSFHPVKNLAMPTGGAVTLNGSDSASNADTLKKRRWCGISDRKDVLYNVTEIGWNFYMNEFSAAIGLVQLTKLDSMNKRRKTIARRYYNEISLDSKMEYDDNCSFHLYWIQVKNRPRFISHMKKHNIQTGVHYMPIHKMSLYGSKVRLPHTENASQKVVSLPMHPNLTESQVTQIIKLVNKYA